MLPYMLISFPAQLIFALDFKLQPHLDAAVRNLAEKGRGSKRRTTVGSDTFQHPSLRSRRFARFAGVND